MKRGHLIIALVVAALAVIFATAIFTVNNQAPQVEGSQTAADPVEQEALPAGPADQPAEMTGSGS